MKRSEILPGAILLLASQAALHAADAPLVFNAPKPRALRHTGTFVSILDFEAATVSATWSRSA